MINITPKFPKKVQFLLKFDFSFVDKLVVRKPFIGGRIGYDKKVGIVDDTEMVYRIGNIVEFLTQQDHPDIVLANKRLRMMIQCLSD